MEWFFDWLWENDLLEIFLIGIFLLFGVIIYRGIRKGVHRKRIEDMKELGKEFKEAGWGNRILWGSMIGLVAVGYIAFRFWIG